MKILVTGGAGYIGSHAVVALLEVGHEPVIFDNFSNASPAVIENIAAIAGKSPAVIKGDMCDRQALDALFSAHAFDAVVHFAALKVVGESLERPLEYYEKNVSGTLSLLRAMDSAGCYRLVYSSSASVYGMSGRAPFAEDAPLSAENPYGQTKLMCERIMADLCRASARWSVVSLRYFNPVGAHESGLIGEKTGSTPSNIFPYIAKVAAEELPFFTVFGDDYPTRDGTGIRDYIHVMDLAEGHVKALDYAAGRTGFDAINLGTGKGISVLELIDAFAKASGRPVPYRVAARRAGDSAVSFADTEKASLLMGFRARRDVFAMCRDGWRFIEKSRA